VGNHNGRLGKLFECAQNVGCIVRKYRFLETFAATAFSMAAKADRCRRPAALRQAAKENLPHPGAAKSAVDAKNRRRATSFWGANLKQFERRGVAPGWEEARRYNTVR